MSELVSTVSTNYRRVVLERLEFHLVQAISRYELEHLCEIVKSDGVAFLRSDFADEMVVRLRASVWCRNKRTDAHEYPESWWDAVKARWFPAWALRRWPARFVRVEVTSGILYPALPTIGAGHGFGEMLVYPIRREVES